METNMYTLLTDAIVDRCDNQDLRVQAQEVQLALTKKFARGKILFNWNGHHRNRIISPKLNFSTPGQTNTIERQIVPDILLQMMIKIAHAEDSEAWHRIKIWKEILGGRHNNWYHLNTKHDIRCYQCGASIQLLFNGMTIKSAEPCPYSKGHPSFHVDIDIPSGVMVFANGFDKLIHPSDQQLQNLNLYGIPEEAERMRWYSEQGVAYGFCGNSCPSIHRPKKYQGRKYLIGNNIKSRRVGSIVTDWWAWTITDLENARKLAQYIDQDNMIETKPGKYRVTQLFYRPEHNDYSNSERRNLFGKVEFLG